MSKASERIRESNNRGSLYLLRRGVEWPCRVERVSLVQNAQDKVREQFADQLDSFDLESKEHIEYKPYDAIDGAQIFRAAVLQASAREDKGLRLPPDLEKALRSGDGIREYEPDSGMEDVRAVAWVVEARQFRDALVAFQVFERSQMLTPDRVLRWVRGNVYEIERASLLSLRADIDAVFVGGALYFKKDFYVKRYIELSEVASEATEADTKAFFQLPLFLVPEGVEVPIDDAWLRRKVNALLTRKDELLNCKPSQIKAAAKRFGVALEVKMDGRKEKLVLPTEKNDVKNLLRVLDEDFYESWQGGRFQAASKRRL